jgi:hypothetical protein
VPFPGPRSEGITGRAAQADQSRLLAPAGETLKTEPAALCLSAAASGPGLGQDESSSRAHGQEALQSGKPSTWMLSPRRQN